MKKEKVLIISVGGTKEPIMKSIEFHKPVEVYFFCSVDTKNIANEICNDCCKNENSFKHYIYIGNHQDLENCTEVTNDIVKKAISDSQKMNLEIIADFTGGTKLMSVALALASITRGIQYSYIGGDNRTKNGLGIVVTGSETVFKSPNPWEQVAYSERKQIADFVNQYEYLAASVLADRLASNNIKDVEQYRNITNICLALHFWDQFQYARALNELIPKRISDLEIYKEEELKVFATDVIKLKPILEVLTTAEKEKNYRSLMLDLFSIAERRFKQGKADDALLRLYRILEMIAQDFLYKNHGIETDKLIVDELPESFLKTNLLQKTEVKKFGTAKIGLKNSYSLISILEPNVKLSKQFEESIKDFKKIMNARNFSNLAHGFKPVKESTYIKLRKFILDLDYFKEKDIIQFPKMIRP